MVENAAAPRRKLRFAFALYMFFSMSLIYLIPGPEYLSNWSESQIGGFALSRFQGSIVLGVISAVIVWILMTLTINFDHSFMILHSFLKIDDLSRYKYFLQNGGSRIAFAREVQKVSSMLSLYMFSSASRLEAHLEKFKDPGEWDCLSRIEVQRVAGAAVRGIYDEIIYKKRINGVQRLELFLKHAVPVLLGLGAIATLVLVILQLIGLR